jgi:hypothetical protein
MADPFYSYNSGYVNQVYRTSHDTQSHHVARHTLPQKFLDEHNLPHSTGNLRLGSSHPRNVPVDNIIDNQVLNGHFQPSYTNGGVYVGNQHACDRIQQQINVMKQYENDGYHIPKMAQRNLYYAAQDAGMDLRAFNGMNFYRPK